MTFQEFLRPVCRWVRLIDERGRTHARCEYVHGADIELHAVDRGHVWLDLLDANEQPLVKIAAGVARAGDSAKLTKHGAMSFCWTEQ